MVTRRAPERRRVPAPGAPLLRGVLCALGAFTSLGALGAFGATQVRGNRLGLRAAATRTTATTLIAVAGRLGPALAAVGHRPLAALFRLLAVRSRQARLGDRVGDGVRDQLHRAD